MVEDSAAGSIPDDAHRFRGHSYVRHGKHYARTFRNLVDHLTGFVSTLSIEW